MGGRLGLWGGREGNLSFFPAEGVHVGCGALTGGWGSLFCTLFVFLLIYKTGINDEWVDTWCIIGARVHALAAGSHLVHSGHIREGAAEGGEVQGAPNRPLQGGTVGFGWMVWVGGWWLVVVGWDISQHGSGDGAGIQLAPVGLVECGAAVAQNGRQRRRCTVRGMGPPSTQLRPLSTLLGPPSNQLGGWWWMEAGAITRVRQVLGAGTSAASAPAVQGAAFGREPAALARRPATGDSGHTPGRPRAPPRVEH